MISRNRYATAAGYAYPPLNRENGDAPPCLLGIDAVILKNTMSTSGMKIFISNIEFRYRYLNSLPTIAVTGPLIKPEAANSTVEIATEDGAEACARGAIVFLRTGAALSP